jgi:hypothetical protein
MHVDWIQGGTIRVLVEKEELTRLGADFDTLKERDPRCKTAVRRILQTVGQKAGLSPGTRLTVEAAPVEGGYLLLITPRDAVTKDAATYIYAFDTEDRLLGMLQQCKSLLQSLPTALYRDEHRFFLVLYQEDAIAAGRIGEFGRLWGQGAVQTARITEYAVPVKVGPGFDQLLQSV